MAKPFYSSTHQFRFEMSLTQTRYCVDAVIQYVLETHADREKVEPFVRALSNAPYTSIAKLLLPDELKTIVALTTPSKVMTLNEVNSFLKTQMDYEFYGASKMSVAKILAMLKANPKISAYVAKQSELQKAAAQKKAEEREHHKAKNEAAEANRAVAYLRGLGLEIEAEAFKALVAKKAKVTKKSRK